MSSRETILRSIRSHLAASPPCDPPESGSLMTVTEKIPVVDLFKQSLEAVNGHCLVVHTEEEMTQILKNVGGRIAISDAPLLQRLVNGEVAPNASDIFQFDVGISTAPR